VTAGFAFDEKREHHPLRLKLYEDDMLRESKKGWMKGSSAKKL